MASSSSSATVGILLLALLLAGAADGQLSPSYYIRSCPKVFDAVKQVVTAAIAEEPRMGASLLRLHFHDCFVQGCDGSILLDDTPTFTGEKTAFPNNGSVRGFDVVDSIKAAVEKVCPGVVSCADILAITARDSVVALGGPSWSVKLGRKDSTTASRALANADIPAPTSSLANLTRSFANVGLSARDMVALSGAHTIGLARCVVFRARIYNETDIDSGFAKLRQGSCPAAAGSGDNNLAPLDLQTPTCFDNDYYKNLLKKEGLLHSDQVLYNGGSTDGQVQSYAGSQGSFFADFATAMVAMGDISPLTGKNGQVRKNCRKVN